MEIGLIGFGSVGSQLYNTLIENGYKNEQLFIFDDELKSGDYKQIFKFQEYKSEKFRHLHFIPTLGYLSKTLKYDILKYLTENRYQIFSYIHPTAFVSKNAKIGRGVIIYPMCNIDQGVEVHDGSIVLNSSIIAHDTIIGKCSYLAPGVCLSGFINVGELSFIGTSATIANNLVIGKNSTIGIGTCVTKDIPENSFAIGNPFKLKDNIKLV